MIVHQKGFILGMRLDLNWWRICVILSLSASSTTVVQSGD